jgi:putative ATP-dependent endonuclease of OLD family
MYISKLRIKNFRSIQDLELDLSPTTILIGPNNAGKSAILEAVRLVLTRRWGQKGTGFTEHDVHLENIEADPKTSPPVSIEITMAESEADEWPAELRDELLELISLDPVTGLNSIVLRVTYAFDTASNIFEPIWEFLNAHGAVITAGRRIVNTSEFFQYLPTFHLGATREAADEFSSRSQFWRKLLKLMTIPANVEERVTASLEAVNAELLAADPRLATITNTLKAVHVVATTGATGDVGVRAVPFDTWDIMSRAEILVQNGTTTPWLPLERHGHGVQSLSVLFLFKAFVEHALAEYFKEQSTPVLTLEEPETHLYPQAARALWSQIKGFQGQKIIATHSPYFIQNAPFRDIRWVRLDGSKTDITSLPKSVFTEIDYVPELDAVLAALGNSYKYSKPEKRLYSSIKVEEDTFRSIAAVYGTHADRDAITAKLKQLQADSLLLMSDAELIDLENCSRRIRGEILFAKKWILAEGQSEYFLLHAIANAMGKPLDEWGVSVIDFQNNGSPGAFASLARALQIPWCIVTDGAHEATQFRTQLERRDFSTTELASKFASHAVGTLEQQLLSDGLEPELHAIAAEINPRITAASTVEAVEGVLKDNKSLYSSKLANMVMVDPTLLGRMPTIFKDAITLMTPEETDTL